MRLSSRITRRSEYSASAAVTGLPEANLAFGFILKVKVLPSSDTDQLSASTPVILVGSAGSKLTSGW